MKLGAYLQILHGNRLIYLPKNSNGKRIKNFHWLGLMCTSMMFNHVQFFLKNNFFIHHLKNLILLNAHVLAVELSAIDLFTGTQVNYYFICKTKLWLSSHQITMEQSSDLVGMGRFIHDTSYTQEKKDIIIDNRIGIDFIKKGDSIIVHEVKKSRKLEDAHKYQLYYYLYYLNEIKGLPATEGILDYPASRERVTLTLTDTVKRR